MCLEPGAHIVLNKLSLCLFSLPSWVFPSFPGRLSPCPGPQQLSRKSTSVFPKALTKVLELNPLGLAWVSCPTLYPVARRGKGTHWLARPDLETHSRCWSTGRAKLTHTTGLRGQECASLGGCFQCDDCMLGRPHGRRPLGRVGEWETS